LKAQPGDKINPLLSIDGIIIHFIVGNGFMRGAEFSTGLDPTQDTPVEILHTILLGIMKYVWHSLNISWTDSQRALFAIRLQSVDLSGLTVPPLRATYIVQYRNNLIGKHFKTLMQTLIFAIHGLVTPAEFRLVQAVGALGAMLWVHEIENIDDYIVFLWCF
jgi:hypothetical protein